MSRYRRPRIDGALFFFTVVLADRSSDLLVQHIAQFRQVYRAVEARPPFETNAICILPDNLHALWTLPPGDADFGARWSQIKSGFSPRNASGAIAVEEPSKQTRNGNLATAILGARNPRRHGLR